MIPKVAFLRNDYLLGLFANVERWESIGFNRLLVPEVCFCDSGFRASFLLEPLLPRHSNCTRHSVMWINCKFMNRIYYITATLSFSPSSCPTTVPWIVLRHQPFRPSSLPFDTVCYKCSSDLMKKLAELLLSGREKDRDFFKISFFVFLHELWHLELIGAIFSNSDRSGSRSTFHSGSRSPREVSIGSTFSLLDNTNLSQKLS